MRGYLRGWEGRGLLTNSVCVCQGWGGGISPGPLRILPMVGQMAPQKLFQLVLVAGRIGFWQFRISEEWGWVQAQPYHLPSLGHFPHAAAPPVTQAWGRRARWALCQGKWLPLPSRVLPEAKWATNPCPFRRPVKVPGQELRDERAPDVDLMVPQKRGNFPLQTALRLAAVDAEISRRPGVNPPRAAGPASPRPSRPPPPHTRTHWATLRSSFDFGSCGPTVRGLGNGGAEEVRFRPRSR